MIRSEDATEYPVVRWMGLSGEEFEQSSDEARQALLKQSSPIKLFYYNEYPMLMAGVYRPNLLGEPWLWVLLTDEIKWLEPSDFRWLVKALDHFAPRCLTPILEGYRNAERLARLFKFVPGEDRVESPLGTYQLYRRG